MLWRLADRDRLLWQQNASIWQFDEIDDELSQLASTFGAPSMVHMQRAGLYHYSHSSQVMVFSIIVFNRRGRAVTH